MSVNGIGGGANYNVHQSAQRRAQGTEYNQAQYLRELNDRLDARVVAGAWNGKSEFGSEKGSTVMIHPDFLRVMHDDPAVGAEYEAAINTYAKTDAEARKRLEAQGHNITSSGMYINEKGEMTAYMAGTKSSGGDKPEMTKTTKEKDEDEKTPRELMEELLERIAEKRQKETLEAERLAEKEAAGATYTIDTTA